MTSATAWTRAPFSVMRRAMMRPISPLPRITTSPAGRGPPIHGPLGRTGGINARRAGAGDVQRTTGALPAAHGQNDGLRLNLHEARLPAGDGQHPSPEAG